MVMTHYLRSYPPPPELPSGLHQVEIQHPRALALDGGSDRMQGWHARTRVTFPEYEVLASSGIPTRQTGTFRSRLLVATEPTAAAGLVNVRFVSADFFGLFGIAAGAGQTFTRDEERSGAAVAVVGRRFAQERLGGGPPVGRTLLIEGRPFRVIAALADIPPERPEWDVVFSARDQDAVYLPFDWGRRLAAWPDHALLQSPVPPAPDAIWQADAVFVSFWLELPDAERRAAYARYLERELAPRRQAYWLRSFAVWRPIFTEGDSEVIYYTIVMGLGLAGAAFTASRLLLAKGLARRSELAIYRALGATRAMLFRMQMLEGLLVAVPAALAGIGSAALQHAFYNRFVAESDVPVTLEARAVLIGLGTAVLAGLLAAAYPAWRASRTPATVYLGRL
jgi:putative ABC transport system permease protein